MSDTAGPLAFRNLIPGLLRAPLRFPLPLLCGLGFAMVTSADEHNIGPFNGTETEFLQVLFVSGFFLTLSATLFAEGRNWLWILRQGLAAAALGLVAAVIWWIGDKDAFDTPAFYMLGPGGALLMTVAAFLTRGADNDAVWNFNLCSWVSMLFGGIVAVGLGLGLTAFLGGLETLFAIDIHGDYYGDVWIVCMSVVLPWQTLAGVPGSHDETPSLQAPRWATYLVSWIVVPLALLYLGLLIAFTLTIVVEWGLPRGKIGWLVGIFAAFGVAAWSAAHPLREAGNIVVRLYYRYFHFALAVPVLLLAVGVGARVSEYGVTEKRYALVLLTVWLAGIALYGVIRRPAKLSVAPASFALMLILGSFGPWGASSISLRSQIGQLEAVLTDAGIFIDGKINPDEGLADQEQSRRISDIVRYLRSSGKMEGLKSWLAEAGATPEKDETNNALLALMGLDYVEAWESGNQFHYSVGEHETIDVTGFELAHSLMIGINDNSAFPPEGAPRSYHAHSDGKILMVWALDRPDDRIRFDLDALAEAVKDRDLDWGDREDQAAMTLEAEAGGLRARLHVEDMSGESSPTGNEISYGNAILLIGRVE